MPVGILCNTGLEGDSHIREVGARITLCGKPVTIPFSTDRSLHMKDAECEKCRKLVGLEPLAKKKE